VEVSNYVSALQFGLKRVKQDFPISIRLIKEMHGVLLAKGRGQTKDPGEFRASQNWIGGSRPGNAVYVPPPRDEVVSLMGQIETFYHEQQSLPALVKAALIHVQFETIRPFLDGNGKLGRVADILASRLSSRRRNRRSQHGTMSCDSFNEIEPGSRNSDEFEGQRFLCMGFFKKALFDDIHRIEGPSPKSTCRNQCNARASETRNCQRKQRKKLEQDLGLFEISSDHD
jgi:hypothetical protein